VLQLDSAGKSSRTAWYFNGNFPWLGMLFCAPVIGLWYWCTDQYIVQRALGAPNQATARRGSIFAAFLKLSPVYLFIVPGLICYALAKSGKAPGLGAHDRIQMARLIPAVSNGAFPMMVKYLLPAGHSRHCGGRIALRPDGLARGRVQRLLHAVHRRSVSEVAPEIVAASARAYGPHRHHRHGVDRPGLDSGDQERQAASTTYLQSVQGYLAPPILWCFSWCLFQTDERPKARLWAMIVGFAWAYRAWRSTLP
jgi:solute:Na+ symporter, SSS family